MASGADGALSLPERVSLWGVRWHQRVAVRRWPGNDSADVPFKVEVTSLDESDDPDDGGSQVRFAMEMNVGLVDDRHAASLRGAVKVNDDQLLAVLDAEVRVLFGEGDAPSDEELVDFAQTWGHDYLMGYLRTGLADSAALVGLPHLILPPSILTRPSRDDATDIVLEAQQRSDANSGEARLPDRAGDADGEG